MLLLMPSLMLWPMPSEALAKDGWGTGIHIRLALLAQCKLLIPVKIVRQSHTMVSLPNNAGGQGFEPR